MGVGIAQSGSTAIYSAAYVGNLGEYTIYKLDFGKWTGDESGRKESTYGAALIGLRFESKVTSLNLQTLIGVATIGNTDSLLGSTGQFTEEVIIGYKRVGIGWKHTSNAGIVRPNLGRDYLTLNVRVPL